MENKINIAELLKDCPKGTKLYSPICGECRVLNIYDRLGFDVICGDDTIYNFSYDGRYNIMGECCIFPSKENRDWSKFQKPFVDGDILVSSMGYPFILKEINKYNNAIAYCALNPYNDVVFDSDNWAVIKGCRLATKEEKARLFDAIKASGYKWNPKTKTLEKLSKFKVGDRIKKNKDHISGIITNISDDGSYKIEYQGGGISYVHPTFQDEWELVPNKFDITNLKPFDKVLIKCMDCKWKIAFYGYYDKDLQYPFVCTNGDTYDECIPYNDETEHLLGTTKDCDEYYKTW